MQSPIISILVKLIFTPILSQLMYPMRVSKKNLLAHLREFLKHSLQPLQYTFARLPSPIYRNPRFAGASVHIKQDMASAALQWDMRYKKDGINNAKKRWLGGTVVGVTGHQTSAKGFCQVALERQNITQLNRPRDCGSAGRIRM